jgi:hypothetical protein
VEGEERVVGIVERETLRRWELQRLAAYLIQRHLNALPSPVCPLPTLLFLPLISENLADEGMNEITATLDILLQK